MTLTLGTKRSPEFHINYGRREGYPECCIQWFTFVWSPVFDWMWDTGQDLYFAPLAMMLRGSMNDNVKCVLCPKCRHNTDLNKNRQAFRDNLGRIFIPLQLIP